MDNTVSQEILDNWPNCSVPDCSNKCAKGSILFLDIEHLYDLTMCYPHSIYGKIVPVAKIIKDREAGLVP